MFSRLHTTARQHVRPLTNAFRLQNSAILFRTMATTADTIKLYVKAWDGTEGKEYGDWYVVLRAMMFAILRYILEPQSFFHQVRPLCQIQGGAGGVGLH